jgi:hypothetical protein
MKNLCSSFSIISSNNIPANQSKNRHQQLLETFQSQTLMQNNPLPSITKYEQTIPNPSKFKLTALVHHFPIKIQPVKLKSDHLDNY